MKRTIEISISALAVLTLIQILGPQLNAQSRSVWGQNTEPQDGVCFYTDANYRGENFCINSNESRPSLGDRYNDRISSVRIFGDAEVTVYENSNFGGQRRTISQDVPSLGEWSDRISSFQSASRRQFGRLPGRPSATPVVNQPSEGVCFYTDANYRGETFCAANGNESAPTIGGYNDRISSIRVFGNAEVTVYEDSNFNGARQTISQDMPNLGAWNDRISSFQGTSRRQYGRQIGRTGEPRDGICFYTDANYRGEDFCVDADERLPSIDRYNDRISSIRIFGDAEVTVYEDSNYGGSRQILTQSVPHLGSWNDRISSFQGTSRQQFGRQPGRRLGNRNREPRNGACFFTDANFGGESFCMSAGDSQRELEGRFKDQISSIQVFGNAQVIVHEHSNFGGASRTFTRDASNLAGTFNDRISSIEVK